MPEREYPVATVVLDPYEEYRRPDLAEIPLRKSLASLLDQSYPADRYSILVTCPPGERPGLAMDASAGDRVRILEVPAGLGYYQKKNHGAARALGEIVLLADGDCAYPRDWVKEMVRAFDRGGQRVAVVQGLSRFDRGPFAAALDAIYWTCGFEPEGPIRQIYSVHNLAIRWNLVDRFRFEDSPVRAGLERIMSPKVRAAGYWIWHNRRAQVTHDTSRHWRDFWRQALGRGHHRMVLWQRHPNPLDRVLGRLGYASIPAYVLLLYLRDVSRQFRGLRERGLAGTGIVKIPLFWAFLLFFHVAGGVGMFRVLRHLRRTGGYPAPEPIYPPIPSG